MPSNDTKPGIVQNYGNDEINAFTAMYLTLQKKFELTRKNKQLDKIGYFFLQINASCSLQSQEDSTENRYPFCLIGTKDKATIQFKTINKISSTNDGLLLYRSVLGLSRSFKVVSDDPCLFVLRPSILNIVSSFAKLFYRKMPSYFIGRSQVYEE